MDDIDFQALKDKLDIVTVQNKKLNRDHLNDRKQIRHLKRIIRGLKEDAEKERKSKYQKQHYKNGKRGSKFNG